VIDLVQIFIMNSLGFSE